MARGDGSPLGPRRPEARPLGPRLPGRPRLRGPRAEARRRSLPPGRPLFSDLILSAFISNSAHRVGAPESMPTKEHADGERERCVTGIDAIDHILNGGIPRGNTVLISGSVGTGKTSICIEFLIRGAINGENSLYLSVTEPTDKLLQNVIPFDFFDDRLARQGKLQFLDLPKMYEKLGIDKEDLDFDQTRLLADTIAGLVEEQKIKRLVLDSVTSVCYRIREQERIRDFLLRLGTVLSAKGCTTLLVSEIRSSEEGHSQWGVEEALADGVIVTGNLERRGDLLRTLQIVKMRGTTHSRAKYVLDLTTSGVLLVPLLKGGSVTGGGGGQRNRRGLGETPRPARVVRDRHAPEVRTVLRRHPGDDRPIRDEEGPRGRLRDVDDPEPEHHQRPGGPGNPDGPHLVRRLHQPDHDVAGEAASARDHRREPDDAGEHHAESRVPPPPRPGTERPRGPRFDQQPRDPQQHEDPERIPPHPGEQPSVEGGLHGDLLDARVRDGGDPEHARPRLRRDDRARRMNRRTFVSGRPFERGLSPIGLSRTTTWFLYEVVLRVEH